MIFAPHPDDALISSAGLIQEHLHRNDRVYIVYMTNGEDYPKAASVFFRKAPINLKEADYIEFGRSRQLEAVRATSILKIPQKHLFFLAYPTNAIKLLFKKFWDRRYRGKRTKTWYASQILSLKSRRTAFMGTNLFGDLTNLLKKYRPAIIILPHPEDTNDDHCFTFRFLKKALKHIRLEYRPEHLLAYFIHFHAAKFFPRPYGYRPGEPSPLPPLKTDYHWVRFNLKAEQIRMKKNALKEFQSQIQIQDNFIFSFIRTDELFAQLKD
ncbi:PIG-L deacetylase family protein [Candidatus Riflebacteria bacterium]